MNLLPEIHSLQISSFECIPNSELKFSTYKVTQRLRLNKTMVIIRTDIQKTEGFVTWE